MWIDVLLQAGVPVEVCHVHEPGSSPPGKGRGKGKAPKTPKKERAEKTPTASARKRKRSDDVESEDSDADAGEPDFSQLDRYTDEEVEEILTPSRKRVRRMTRSTAGAALGAIQESPAKQLRPMGSRPEMVTPPGSQGSRTSSKKRAREDEDE